MAHFAVARASVPARYSITLHPIPDSTTGSIFYCSRSNLLARTEIEAGICGLHTTVEARMEGDECVLSIQSACPAIQSLAAELKVVDPLREITYRGAGPVTLQLAARYCKHTACPVPAGIIKAVEVAAGLALPRDAAIRVRNEET
jgi:hypothetical protein